MNTMLLHASSLTFNHPVSAEAMVIEAPLQPEFIRSDGADGLGLINALPKLPFVSAYICRF